VSSVYTKPKVKFARTDVTQHEVAGLTRTHKTQLTSLPCIFNWNVSVT